MAESGSSKRTVKAVVTSYKAPDGSIRVALRGEDVEVATDDVKRFDKGEGEIPALAK